MTGTVKALEWKATSFNSQSSESIIGCFFVEYREPLNGPRKWYWHHAGGRLVEAANETSAKAAAQAVYEQRILSAIKTTASGDAKAVHGPYGYLIKPHGLNEEHWTLAFQPSDSNDETSIPLFAKDEQALGAAATLDAKAERE